MSRTPRRYAVHLHLVGGQTERVFFPKLETFQEWYQGVGNAENSAVSSKFPCVIWRASIWSYAPKP